jgi:hypothetical protein
VQEIDEAKKQLKRILQDIAERKQDRDLLETQMQKMKEDSAKFLDICELSRADLQKTKEKVMASFTARKMDMGITGR